MTNPDEVKAREIIGKYFDYPKEGWFNKAHEDAIQAIAQALALTRQEAIEKCVYEIRNIPALSLGGGTYDVVSQIASHVERTLSEKRK